MVPESLWTLGWNSAVYILKTAFNYVITLLLSMDNYDARLKRGGIEILQFLAWGEDKAEAENYRHYQEVTVVRNIYHGYMYPLVKHWPWDGPRDTPGTTTERLFPGKRWLNMNSYNDLWILPIHSHVTGYGNTESAPITRATSSHGEVGKPG